MEFNGVTKKMNIILENSNYLDDELEIDASFASSQEKLEGESKEGELKAAGSKDGRSKEHGSENASQDTSENTHGGLSKNTYTSKERSLKIIEILMQNIHHVDTELSYDSPYTLLIAVLLSAQSTDVAVNKITPVLFANGSTPQHIISLGEEKIRSIIRTIGFFNVKARNIYNLSKILVNDFDGKVPSTREELESLPGIGRKSANVILNCVYGLPTIAVDTHIFRVANRMEIATGKKPIDVEKKLIKLTPKKYLKEIHSVLVLHGRYTCKARKPLCSKCPVMHLCPFFEKISKK